MIDGLARRRSGSGCVTAFLSGICGPTAAGKSPLPLSVLPGPDPKQHTRTVYLTTDLNPIACESTLLTAETNSHPLVETVNTDLTASLLPRLTRQVDVLVFNPPYVETVDEEAIEAQAEEDKGIEKTWAGGHHGMRVTNRLLEQVKVRCASDVRPNYRLTSRVTTAGPSLAARALLPRRRP